MSKIEQPPILVVAALGYELKKLRASDCPGLVLLETGEGVPNAERHLEAWFNRHVARAVLSIGFAGALSPSLRPGEMVIATKVRDSNAVPDAKLISAAEQVGLDVPLHFGAALTSDEIVWLAESKRELARSLEENELGFVDMESTAVARVCYARSVPFLIARSITDLLEEDLPLDFNQYRNGDGRVNPKRVMKTALLRPAVLKGLLELRRRSNLCGEKMADFVKRMVPLIS